MPRQFYQQAVVLFSSIPASRSHRGRPSPPLFTQGAIDSWEVATDHTPIAVEQDIGKTVEMTVKRPRAGMDPWVSIVSEGGSHERYK